MKLVAAVAESRGWRVLEPNLPRESQAIHLTPGATISAPSNCFGLAVLLHEHDVELGATGLEARWSPRQILCYLGTEFKAKDENIRMTCLLLSLDVIEN